MFGWFKRKSSPSPAAATAPSAAAPADDESQQPSVLLSFVLLESESFSLEELAKALRQQTCGGLKFQNVKIEKDHIISCELGDEMCFISLMPPYPWAELEGPCQTAWMWPPETSPMSLKDHKAHLLITLTQGRGDKIARLRLLTAVTALVAKQPGVVGVYWPDATLVHYPPIFIDIAAHLDSPDAPPPLYLWVDYRLFRNDDSTIGMFTTGLKSLGHMEIEIPSIDMPPDELREWTMSITYYLLENGPILKHGETIGMSADHKVKITHAPSRFGHEGKVLCFGE